MRPAARRIAGRRLAGRRIAGRRIAGRRIAGRRLLPLATVALLAAAGTPAAAQPILDVEITPDEITVGDRITARLTLVWDGETPASEPRFPAWGQAWGQAEVLRAGQVESSTAGGRRVYVQSLVLTAFRAGEVLLPRVSVAVPLAAETVEVPSRAGAGFTVRSVLPAVTVDGGEAEEPEPRGAAPLRRRGTNWRPYATNGVLALLCLLVARRLGRRLRTVPAAAGGVRQELLPLEELLAGLDAVDPAASEPAHTALSLALRRFLGRKLEIVAVESTTSEIHRRLHDTAVRVEEARRTVTLLRQCDQVKFARQEVAAAATTERLAEAKRLGEAIEEGLRPREETAAEDDLEKAA